MRCLVFFLHRWSTWVFNQLTLEIYFQFVDLQAFGSNILCTKIFSLANVLHRLHSSKAMLWIEQNSRLLKFFHLASLCPQTKPTFFWWVKKENGTAEFCDSEGGCSKLVRDATASVVSCVELFKNLFKGSFGPVRCKTSFTGISKTVRPYFTFLIVYIGLFWAKNETIRTKIKVF